MIVHMHSMSDKPRNTQEPNEPSKKRCMMQSRVLVFGIGHSWSWLKTPKLHRHFEPCSHWPLVTPFCTNQKSNDTSCNFTIMIFRTCRKRNS